jgi:hypothetical protein
VFAPEVRLILRVRPEPTRVVTQGRFLATTTYTSRGQTLRRISNGARPKSCLGRVFNLKEQQFKQIFLVSKKVGPDFVLLAKVCPRTNTLAAHIAKNHGSLTEGEGSVPLTSLN